MDFKAQLKGVNLKARVIPVDSSKDEKPATATIQLVVESPPVSVMELLCRLANDGDELQVNLTNYQLAQEQVKYN
ncbi:MAG: hypothetical protein V3V32_04625 [Dehalococcoidia bacterium]